MTAVNYYQSGLLVRSTSKSAMVLLAQICFICYFIISTFKLLVFSSSFFARLKVYLGYKRKLWSQNRAAANKMTSTIYTSLVF